MGSHWPAPEVGISKIQLRRPIAAGAFLLGLPEGGTSEWEALPCKPCCPWVKSDTDWQPSLLSLVGVNGPGSPDILTCRNWVVLPKTQEARRKAVFRIEYICCLSWTWLTLNSCVTLSKSLELWFLSL